MVMVQVRSWEEIKAMKIPTKIEVQMCEVFRSLSAVNPATFTLLEIHCLKPFPEKLYIKHL